MPISSNSSFDGEHGLAEFRIVARSDHEMQPRRREPDQSAHEIADAFAFGAMEVVEDQDGVALGIATAG